MHWLTGDDFTGVHWSNDGNKWRFVRDDESVTPCRGRVVAVACLDDQTTLVCCRGEGGIEYLVGSTVPAGQQQRWLVRPEFEIQAISQTIAVGVGCRPLQFYAAINGGPGHHSADNWPGIAKRLGTLPSPGR